MTHTPEPRYRKCPACVNGQVRTMIGDQDLGYEPCTRCGGEAQVEIDRRLCDNEPVRALGDLVITAEIEAIDAEERRAWLRQVEALNELRVKAERERDHYQNVSKAALREVAKLVGERDRLVGENRRMREAVHKAARRIESGIEPQRVN